MGSRARVRARARATARVGLVHAHMFSPNMAFITPMPMNMPSISRLEKTIVAMEQVFQLRSCTWRLNRVVRQPATGFVLL